MKTKEAIEQFLRVRRARQVTDSTIRTYEFGLGKIQELYPDELPDSPNDIYEIFLANPQLAPITILGIWRNLRAFWRWLEEEGIAPNIMARIPAPATKRTLPRYLNRPETQRLLRSAKTQRERAIVAVLLDTGVRVAELASMTRQNVSPFGIRVSGKVGDRLVPISPGVYDLINRQGDEEHIWTGRKGCLTKDGLAAVVRNLMIAAGLKGAKLGPHTLRHTFAVQYLVNGGDLASLQQILGHASVETTMVYTTMTLALVARQHRKFSPMKDFSPTNEPDRPSQDSAMLSEYGRKSGQVRRAQKAERDAKILDMLAGGATKTEAAIEFGLHPRTVKRVQAREDRGINGQDIDCGS